MAHISHTDLRNAADLFNIAPVGLQFTLKAGTLPVETFSVIRFDLVERYNELFELDVLLMSPNPSINFGAVLDNLAEFSIWQNGECLRTVTGMATVFEQGDTGFHKTAYRICIQPSLWRLTQRRNSRIFQQKNIETILTTLLKEGHVPAYTFNFTDQHPEREFCVQYRETDYQFLQRLCAEEGIFFFFRQSNDGFDEVIFCDDARRLNKTGVNLTYNLNRNAQLQENTITSLRCTEQIRTSHNTLKDYTFKKPRWSAEFSREANNSQNQRQIYEHYDYPGRYKDTLHGEAFTRYRLDALRRDAHLGSGESNSAQLQVGGYFKLLNHPNQRLNDLWQLTQIIHHGEQPQAAEQEAGGKGTYLTNQFEFIPPDQSYRANLPQKPQIHGTQTAVVVGPENEEIYCDEYGRVRVQFHWDRLGEMNDHSSCWIRVSHPWAGQGWGMLAIPRIGQEVIVSFQESDPDQPIITGRVYNALNMPPGNLPQTRTQMHIRSKTYKGKGYNSMLMEDAPGNELLAFHAEKNMDTVVENDQTYTIKNDRSIDVISSQTVNIGRGRTTTIKTGNDIKSVLAGNDISNIQLNHIRNILVGNHIKNILVGNDITNIKAGDLIENIEQLRTTRANEMFQFANERIELEVGKKTSLTLDNEKILLRFGQSTLLMDDTGIWLDGKHIGWQEREQDLPDNGVDIKKKKEDKETHNI